jgi:hypothetical protein
MGLSDCPFFNEDGQYHALLVNTQFGLIRPPKIITPFVFFKIPTFG